MKVFVMLFFVLCSAAVFSQRPVPDTSAKELQRQINALTRQVDSLRVIATNKSDQLNKASEQLENAVVLLQKARAATIFDYKLFIDSLVPRMVIIHASQSDFIFKTILQYTAITETMQKALNVYKPEQKKIVDSMSLQYIDIDNRRRAIQGEFDNLLIQLDDRMGALDELKKKAGAK